jgi:dephospho-CoA kinase
MPVPAPIVAVTGGIGCGKSGVARLLSELGVAVLDADDVARDAMSAGRPLVAEIAAAFGRGVLRPDGTLDRPRLADIVFGDRAQRERLNALVHPPVMAAIGRWTAQRRAARASGAVVVPLLFEIGAETGWDAVVCVACDAEVAAARLRLRGMSDEDIARRRAAQMDLSEKIRRSDFTIWNNDSVDALSERVRQTWREISKRRA